MGVVPNLSSPPVMPVPLSAAHRRAVRAGAIASFAFPMLLFLWFVTAGSWDLFRSERLGDFHDSQARSFLDGRIDVPPEAVHIEGIVVDGRTYLYFGPVPALLRLPVFVVTDRLDGRLSAPSMLLAFGITLFAARSIASRLAPDDPFMTRTAMPLLAGTSVLVFLASRAFVYHEAILWGVALALSAYDQIVALSRRFSWGRLAAASALAAGALLSRASVGIGAAIAVGLFCAPLAWTSLRQRRLPRLFALAALAVAPVVLYAGINYAKFESLFRLPLDKQVFTGIDPNRQAALEANGGSLFGFGFVPTTLLHYSRPDALTFPRTFPWVSFPDRAEVVGDAVFDTIDFASSVPATMPALLALSAIGIVSVVRRRDTGFAIPAIGAAAGSATVLTIGFIAHRYLGDVVPLLVVLGAAGLVAATRLSSAAARRVTLGLVAVLALFSTWVNVGLALEYQRAYGPNATPEVRASLLHMKHDLPGGPLRLHGAGPALPASAGRDELFAIGECDGLYWSDGRAWHAVERTPATGKVKGRVRAVRTRTVVATAGTSVIIAEAVGANEVRLVYEGADGERYEGQPATVSSEDWELDLVVDRRVAHATGAINGNASLDVSYLLIPQGDVELARAVNPLPTEPPVLCRELSGEQARSRRQAGSRT